MKLLCLDILCLATWTWITISTLIWLLDLCLILSLFTGNFTAAATFKNKYQFDILFFFSTPGVYYNQNVFMKYVGMLVMIQIYIVNHTTQ